MSKYFLDCEFHEYKKRPFLGKAIDTIELISIGLVAEDGREYYSISKDFDVKAAWNNVWLRCSVLHTIWKEHVHGDMRNVSPFSCSSVKAVIKGFGKSNKQIAKEIITFINSEPVEMINYNNGARLTEESNNNLIRGYLSPELYGFYSGFDYVAFSWLFGRMSDLPNGFPMHFIDLKQTLDEKATTIEKLKLRVVDMDREDINNELSGKWIETDVSKWGFYQKLQLLKHQKEFPKEINSHHALQDAKWNYELYKFLQSL